MIRAGLLALLPMLMSCDTAPAPNCAIPPPGFHDFEAAVYPPWAGIGVEPPQVNIIKLHRSGAVTWNGVSLGTVAGAERTLNQYLSMSGQLQPQPFTALDFNVGVSCRSVQSMRALMLKHLNCYDRDKDASVEPSKRCIQGQHPYQPGGRLFTPPPSNDHEFRVQAG